MDAPPPPAPPHGDSSQNPNGKRGGLPEGHYDIFVVPPQSAGGGFIYFPSLQPQRNSFIAGSLCTLLLVVLWWVVTPVLKEWFSMIVASGGAGVALLLVLVGGAAWGLGRVNLDGSNGATGGSGAGAKPNPFNAGGTYANGNGFHPGPGSPPQSENYYQHSRQGSYNFQSSTSSPPPGDSAKAAWERAKEETRRKEEEKRKADELRRKADDLRRKREEAEKEKQKEREKETREREIRERRERLAKEREERTKKEKETKEAEEKEKLLRELREKEAREKAVRDAERAARLAKLKAEREARAASPQKPDSNFKQASARTEPDQETMYSFRPYDKPKSPKKAPTAYTSSQSSFAASSYAASESTARSTPPPSHSRGPYSTKDPEKIVIKGVYSFNNALNRTPLATLQSGVPPVSDGLVLRITTEGMFIDDDLRGVPQREWDVKAWTLKSVETGQYRGLHILRSTIRSTEGQKYVFVFGPEENWKADQGVSRLRKSPQAQNLNVSGLGLNEAKSVLESTGWI